MGMGVSADGGGVEEGVRGGLLFMSSQPTSRSQDNANVTAFR